MHGKREEYIIEKKGRVNNETNYLDIIGSAALTSERVLAEPANYR